jgi:hypothetical protein
MAKYLSLIFVLLSIASCKKAEMQEVATAKEDVKLLQANIASVNGPLTAKAQDSVAFTISWPHTGDHHAFNSFKTDTINASTYKIKLFVDASSCKSCMPDTSSHSSVYNFKPAKNGTYYLKFYGKDTTKAITDTLKVK